MPAPREFLDRGEDPFGFSRLRYIRDVSESKALNDLRGPYIILSASGMCEAGRILHHLRNNIEDPRNTVLITGFQAEHTVGRKIVDKLPEVPIFGEPMRLRAEVVKLNELSGHADQRGTAAVVEAHGRHSQEGLPGSRRAFAADGAGQGDSGAVRPRSGDPLPRAEFNCSRTQGGLRVRARWMTAAAVLVFRPVGHGRR